MICGTKALREVFDSHISPKDLQNKLNDPPVLSTLQKLKSRRILNQDQWVILFPPSGTVVESKSFDITLLITLLREICGITSPVTGWKKYPDRADTTLGADLVRIKYYRNKLAHDNNGMELDNNDFNTYWEEIKNVILRIVSNYSDSSTVKRCEKDIDKFRTAKLSKCDFVCVMELFRKCSELIVSLTTRISLTGAKWIQGSAFILNSSFEKIVECFGHTKGLDVMYAAEGSVKIVLWVTELNALEKFWRRYETEELRKDLERILITEELKQLANGEAVELEVHVSEEQYKKAHEQLKAKEELAKKVEEKLKLDVQIDAFDGDIFEVGENKFQAHLAVVTSKDQVEQVMAELKKKDSDVAKATHNIWAYRIFEDEKDMYIENCDDDGDVGLGARVLYFLKRTEAINVMVVVSCWYETTADNLGDVRFKCIQKCVLDLFLMCRLVEIPASKLKKFFEETKYTPFEIMPEKDVPEFEIIHGETIEDRKSIFQGHVADVTSRDQVNQVLSELKKDRKIAKAKYNMWACRIYDEKKKSYLEEGNDDGENLGGERLLHLLQRSNAKNVVIIVTRWHGGIHLGNDRFKHINKCASDLLQQRSRRLSETSVTPGDPIKTKKVKAKKHK